MELHCKHIASVLMIKKFLNCYFGFVGNMGKDKVRVPGFALGLVGLDEDPITDVDSLGSHQRAVS